MDVHKELKNSFVGAPDKTKQLTEKDLLNRTNYNHVCSGFDVKLEIEVNNKILPQEFHFRRVLDIPKTWRVTTLLGDNGPLGCIPLQVMYEVPSDLFPLVKVAAMGMIYLKLTLSERMAYYETLNYEITDKVNGL